MLCPSSACIDGNCIPQLCLKITDSSLQARKGDESHIDLKTGDAEGDRILRAQKYFQRWGFVARDASQGVVPSDGEVDQRSPPREDLWYSDLTGVLEASAADQDASHTHKSGLIASLMASNVSQEQDRRAYKSENRQQNTECVGDCRVRPTVHTCPAGQCLSSGKCREGATGPACALCTKGRVRIGSQCVNCEKDKGEMVAIIALAIFLFPTVVWYCLCTRSLLVSRQRENIGVHWKAEDCFQGYW